MGKLLWVARPYFLVTGLFLFVIGASWAILLGAPFSLSRILLGYPGYLSNNDHFGSLLSSRRWVYDNSGLKPDDVKEIS